MKLNKLIAIPALALTAGLSLAACGSSGSGSSSSSSLPPPNPIAQALAVKTLEGDGWPYNPPDKATLMNVTGMDGDAWSTGNTNSQEAVLVFDNIGDANTAGQDMADYISSNGYKAILSMHGVVVAVRGPYYPGSPTSDPVVNTIIMGAPQGSPSTQAPVTAVPAAQQSAQQQQPAPATPAPAPATPASTVTDPWAVMADYYGLIESGNFPAAWNLQSPAFQGQSSNYQTWMNGYACTGAQTLTEISESGDTVYVKLSAVENCKVDDPTQYFSGSFTVDNGLITSASMTETG